jgi:hypothetical protein
VVASFAAAAALRGQAWTYVLRIEGIGDYDGQHTWTINPPDFVGLADNRYLRRDTIAALPQITPERTKSMLGGMPEAGAMTIELVDYADLITAARRTDAPPSATMAADVDAGATVIDVEDGSDLPTDEFVVWIGAEAIAIESRTGNALTVATDGRGFLGTDARSHSTGDSVYQTCPFLRTRRMTLWLAPQDADNDTVATEYVVGTYRIDRCKLGRQLGAWVLSGPTEIRDLSRLVAGRVAVIQKVIWVNGEQSVRTTMLPGRLTGNAAAASYVLGTLATWPDLRAWTQVDRTDEVLRLVYTQGDYNEPRFEERGALGSARDTIEIGDIMRSVLVSDATYGSFRWSPGPTPSESRSSGTWTISTHVVDILLCLLTSASHPDDGLELLNYDATHGNWSSLPPGYGIGFPASRIDFDSFLAVRARYAQMRLPALILGDKDPQTMGEWVTENILEPFGWFLTTTGGRLTLIAPRLLLRGENADATLDADTIIDYSEPEESYDLVAGAVTYQYRGSNGEPHTTTVRSSDFTGLFGGRAQYAGEDETAIVKVPGMLVGAGNTDALLTLMAQRRLIRAARAPWRITFTVDAALHTLAVGNVVSITHADMPDLFTGARGWTYVLGQITAASQVTIDRENRATRTLTVLVYPSFRSARIAPSAMITGVAGVGPWVCTVAANRYTSPDGDDYLGLAATDADAFDIGLVGVKTINRAGVDVTTGYDLTAVGANTLTLAGGVAPVAGDVIVFSDYPGEDPQAERYAAWANDRGFIVTDVPADRYGEP